MDHQAMDVCHDKINSTLWILVLIKIVMLTSKDNLSEFIKAEIEAFYNIKLPECPKQNQLMYTLSRYFLGLYEKKLFVSRLSGEVINYKVSHYLFKIKVA